MQYYDMIESPVGDLTVASDGECLTGLWLDGQKYFMATAEKDAERKPGLGVLEQAREWLAVYFTGADPGPIPKVRPKGTGFRQEVWELLQAIPYGSMSTYGELANKIAKQRGLAKMSARAVGGAVGHNPISIIVPCHRVIGSNLSLTGFGGGIARKIQLLKLEGIDTSKLTVPTKGTAL